MDKKITRQKCLRAYFSQNLFSKVSITLLDFFRQRGELVPSDTEVDNWLQEDLAEIASQSSEKLELDNLTALHSPLIITGPILWKTIGIPSSDIRWKTGRDGVVRFSVYQVVVVHLLEYHLAASNVIFNLLKNDFLIHSTVEYHYSDIVSVSIVEDTTSHTLLTGDKLLQAQVFRLPVASGERIQIVIGGLDLERVTGGIIPTNRAGEAVEVIYNLLREKKSG